MSYEEMARLEVLSAVSGINSKKELDEFRNMLARYFANKAQKAIDALWDSGEIDDVKVEEWGNEHLRTPYRHA